MKKKEKKRFHDPNPERWRRQRRSHSRLAIISLHYFPPSLPSSSSSWRLSEILTKLLLTATGQQLKPPIPIDTLHFSDLKAQWKSSSTSREIWTTTHLTSPEKKTFFAGPEQAHIYHQFYFLHVVVIVNLDTDISHFEMYFARRFDMMANNKWGKFSMVELAVDSRSSYSAATLQAEGGKRARFVREKPENWRTCRKTRNNSLTTVQCLNKRSKLATWNECFFSFFSYTPKSTDRWLEQTRAWFALALNRDGKKRAAAAMCSSESTNNWKIPL